MQARYGAEHPGWELVEATGNSAGEWCKGAVVNPAVAAIDAEIVVLADADVWPEGLVEAVDAVRGGAPWAMPHALVNRLSEDGTAAVLAGASWRGQPLDDDEDPYTGVMGGGALVARRETLQEVPIDERFVGWGQEDECHAIALHALAGEGWRGEADLIHLWHPSQERWTRRRGSKASWRLRCRYAEVRDDPGAMRALLEEPHAAATAH